MKKVIILVVLAAVFLVGCNSARIKNENQTDDIVSSAPDSGAPEYSINATSLEGIVDKLSDSGTSTQSLNSNSVFVQAAQNVNLSFNHYYVYTVNYVREPTYSYLSVYWHDIGCTALSNCFRFELKLQNVKEGIEEEGYLKGYTQIENDFYMKEVAVNRSNKTLYIYLINDHYLCRYSIDNELEDHDAVADQLKNFCREIQSSLKNDATVK